MRTANLTKCRKNMRRFVGFATILAALLMGMNLGMAGSASAIVIGSPAVVNPVVQTVPPTFVQAGVVAPVVRPPIFNPLIRPLFNPFIRPLFNPFINPFIDLDDLLGAGVGVAPVAPVTAAPLD